MASDANVILITGANRGIGLGFTRSYLMMEGATVIAAVRDPSSVSSKALAQLPRGRGSSLVILKIDACSSVDALEAAKTIRHMSIKHIDIAIANAAVGYIYPTVKDLQVADLQAHMEPNVYGNVRLYQAILPLLLAAAEPKWVTIGSLGGSIGQMVPFPHAAYSPTKIAVHWSTKKMNMEEERLCAFVLNPGFVGTDSGKFGAKALGLEGIPLMTVEESCKGMIEVIRLATKTSHGGQFFNFSGEGLQW